MSEIILEKKESNLMTSEYSLTGYLLLPVCRQVLL